MAQSHFQHPELFALPLQGNLENLVTAGMLHSSGQPLMCFHPSDAIFSSYSGTPFFSHSARGALPLVSKPVLSIAPVAEPKKKTKQRFCATFPNVERCQRTGNHHLCPHAHSREEIEAPLLSAEEEARVPTALTSAFFTQRFKTLWCPIGRQHDWQLCMYAHTYQDARRPPSIGYGNRLCPYWNRVDSALDYSQRCHLGTRCPYAHGAKEQLYHPNQFKVSICKDLDRGKKCARRQLCAFYHNDRESRAPACQNVDYRKPLNHQSFPTTWEEYFLSPPHFEESFLPPHQFNEEQGVLETHGGVNASLKLPVQSLRESKPKVRQCYLPLHDSLFYGANSPSSHNTPTPSTVADVMVIGSPFQMEFHARGSPMSTSSMYR
jgi:hypothetical protein